MDLNRGWLGRTEEAETLFGKGALSAWSKDGFSSERQKVLRVRFLRNRTQGGEGHGGTMRDPYKAK